jgi:hypothetical protein
MPLAALHDEDVDVGSQDDLPTTVAPMHGGVAAALAMEVEAALARAPSSRSGIGRELPLLHDSHAPADPDEVGETVLIGRDERLGNPPRLYDSGVLDRGSTAPHKAAAVALRSPTGEVPSGQRAVYARPSPLPPAGEAGPLGASFAPPPLPTPLPREMSAGRKFAVGLFVFLLTSGALTAGVVWLWLNGLPSGLTQHWPP